MNIFQYIIVVVIDYKLKDIMKTVKKEIDLLVAERGKILEVIYEGEIEPVYYDRIARFLIGENDIVREVDKFS